MTWTDLPPERTGKRFERRIICCRYAAVRAAGGTLEVDAVIGEGCRVTVGLPPPRRADDDAGFRPVHGGFGAGCVRFSR